MAADGQWPSGLGPDTICFYFTVDVECLAEEVLVDLRTLFDQHGVRATFFRYDVWNSRSRARASSQFPPQQRHLPGARRMARSLSPTRTGHAERARLRARGQGPSRSQPLLRLGGAPAAPALSSAWHRIRLQLSDAPPGRFTSVPEAPRDRGNPDLLWRPFRCHDWRDRHLLAARGPGTGARTPLIYLLMAVSARRLSTATVGEVNVHWRSVAKWM
jgi:hypothetical protein